MGVTRGLGFVPARAALLDFGLALLTHLSRNEGGLFGGERTWA